MKQFREINRLTLLFLLGVFFTCMGDKRRSALTYIDPNPPSPMEKIAETLSKNTTKSPPLLVIVLSFTSTNGKPHSLGKVLAEKVTTELVKKGNLKILDRLMFEKILQDNHISLSGSIDITLAKKIGEILKLDAIVMGTINQNGQGVDINCRIIDSKTGMIMSAEETFYVPGIGED